MRQLMNRVLARYGNEAVLHTAAGEQKIKVFFESVNSKSLQNMQSRYHALGKLPGGRYICRFSGQVEAKAGDTLQINGQKYRLCRVEEMLGPRGCVFRWAICTGKGSEDTWGQ